MSFSYEHPRPAVAVDCVVFGFDDGELKIMLIERGIGPFKGQWALPGGFVRMDESLEEAARRELVEETGIDHLYLEQLYSFGEPQRDPRGRVISIAWYALVNLADHTIRAATDAAEARWFALAEVPQLAFDHAGILEMALQRLKGKVRYQPIGFELLPEKFKLSALQHLYEVILEKPLDKRNFRKKVLSMGLLEELDETEQDVAHRAARLYRFDKASYEDLVKKGFLFEIQAVMRRRRSKNESTDSG